MLLKIHSVILKGHGVKLRPLTEADWPVLQAWNSDPEVLYFSEGADIQAYNLDQVKSIYRSVSQNALCFMIELDGRPIGEAWLQRMNLERILVDYPGYDLRRIDLMIGEKSLWGRGLGTEVIRLLTDLAFQQEGADYVFAVGIADYNFRSQRAFQKNDYRLVGRIPQPAGAKSKINIDLAIKNPRLGFQAYVAHLFFDPATETAIREVWRELADRGIAPYLYRSANRPHMTLGIYRGIDLPSVRYCLAHLAGARSPLPVSFPSFGIFPGSEPTIFLGPIVTQSLLDLHLAIDKVFSNLVEYPDFDYYRPGHWVPHAALATEFDGAHLNEAMDICQKLPIPLNGEVCEIGLVEMRPIRHLACWEFTYR